MIITQIYRPKSFEPEEETTMVRHPIPDAGKRTFDVEKGQIRVDYWVYPGTPKRLYIGNDGKYISGSSYSRGEWGSLTDIIMPANNGNTYLKWEVELRYADRGLSYEIRVLVNGSEKMHKMFRGKGPLFPWESGFDTIDILWEHPFKEGDRIEVYGRVGNNGTSKQALTSKNSGYIGYLQPS